MGRTSKREKPIFAKNIVARRKTLGWSAHKLAEKAKIPYPTLRDIEAGNSEGWPQTKEAIAKALGAAISDLYRQPDAPGKLPDFTSAVDFLSSFGSLKPDLQKIVLSIVHRDVAYAKDVSPEFLKKCEPLLKAL